MSASIFLVPVAACGAPSDERTSGTETRDKDQQSRVSDVGTIPFRHVIIDAHENVVNPIVKGVGDINGDGLPDVVVGSGKGRELAPLTWYEYPNWSRHVIGQGHFSTDMQVGDIDGDGDLDVIIPIWPEEIRWYENPAPKWASRIRKLEVLSYRIWSGP